MNNFFGSLLRFLLTIVAGIVLFAAIVAGCVKLTVFNQDYMAKQITQSGITQTLQNELTQQVQNYGRDNGVPSDVLANVVPQDLVEQNVKSYLGSVYDGTSFQLTGQDQLTTNVQHALTQYAQQQGLPVTDQVTNGIQSVSQSIGDSISQFMNNQQLTQYGQQLASYRSQTNQALLIFSIASLVLWLLLLGASRGGRLKLRGTSRMLGLAGLLTLAVPFGLSIANVTNYLQLPNVEVKTFIEQLLSSFTSVFWIAGGVCLLLAVIVFLISLFSRKNAGMRHAR